MKFGENKFWTFCDRYGRHEAVTHTFSSEIERDNFAKKLAKARGVAYIKRVDRFIVRHKEYWVTAHYADKSIESPQWIKQKKVKYSESNAKLYKE